MAFVFKILLGNPDIMATLLTWAVLVSIALTVMEINRDKDL